MRDDQGNDTILYNTVMVALHICEDSWTCSLQKVKQTVNIIFKNGSLLFNQLQEKC